jgi:nucleotide-binding universal stress UspA family protein
MKTILLSVDTSTDVAGATALVHDLLTDADHVVVLHVHEYATGRFGRIQVDCADGAGESVVENAVSRLRQSGVDAAPEIRKTPVGHIARTILDVGNACDARVIVLGSSGSRDLPMLPFGSVSLRLLHMADRPVLIVPSSLVVAEQPRSAVSASSS